MKRCHWLVAAALFGLAACTEMGYVKPGVSDAEFVADSEDCADIASRQALRDYSLVSSRARFSRSYGYDRRYWGFRDFPASLSSFEFRYRQLCMFSRGYELAPLDEEPASDGPASDGPASDGPAGDEPGAGQDGG